MENFLDSIDFSKLILNLKMSTIKDILKDNGISEYLDKVDEGGNKVYNPSWEYIGNYLKEKRKEFKEFLKGQNLYKDAPVLNKDFSAYVILANIPFVEEEKRDKFKNFLLEKKFPKEIKQRELIKEFIFPYKNDDKSKYASWLLILKLDNYESAKLVANSM